MKQTRNLEDLLRQYDLLAAPAARDAAVTGICNDSRRARDGDLFICKGYGFKPEYLAMARRQGAVCALAETDFPGVDIPASGSPTSAGPRAWRPGGFTTIPPTA
ncbi:MAG: hypothetical protein ACLR5H_11565 [Oscillospiraceae bacterium]